MSREVIIAELEKTKPDFVRKMRNWVRAKDGGTYAMTDAYDGMQSSSGYAESRIPILRGEASEIDIALVKVPARESLAVSLFWQYEGNSLRWLGRRLAISDVTAKSRVERGHERLQYELAQLAAAQYQAREELAEVQATGGSRRATGSIMVVHRLNTVRPIDRPKIKQ